MKIQRAEKALLAIGLTLLAIWGAARIHRTVGSRAAITRFHAENTSSLAPSYSVAFDPVSSSRVDFRLWPNKRIEAYEDSLAKKTYEPLAILRCPKSHL